MNSSFVRQALTEGKHVELDVTVPPCSGSLQVAVELSHKRAEDIRRGRARVAYIYDKEGTGRELLAEVGVTDEECGELAGLGAKWIGSKIHAPIVRRKG